MTNVIAFRPVILIDTDVFTRLHRNPSAADRRTEVSQWTEALRGATRVISFQTHAELLQGAYIDGWGARRLNKLRVEIEKTPIIHVDEEVIEAFARLAERARKVGHHFGDVGHHTADRWIAACAIAKGLPLLTGNLKHFRGTPDLTLVEVAGTCTPVVG